MKNWNLPLQEVQKEANVPITRLALAAAAAGNLEVLVGALDEEVALVLLDAAIVLGEPDAVPYLAQRCGGKRPLRIWAQQDFVKIQLNNLPEEWIQQRAEDEGGNRYLPS